MNCSINIFFSTACFHLLTSCSVMKYDPPNSTLYRCCSGDDVEPRDPGDFEETGDWEKTSEQDSNSSSWG